LTSGGLTVSQREGTRTQVTIAASHQKVPNASDPMLGTQHSRHNWGEEDNDKPLLFFW
jgi:hypothetical protein